MPPAMINKSSTPLSTTSSLPTNNVSTAIQSGPYTKAQFQNTMEGSRSIKNAKEVEQLLRDYPAAMELYRTGKYKVKVKYEADVERVILVEKRSSKGIAGNTAAPTKDTQDNSQVSPNVVTNGTKSTTEVTKDKDSDRSRSRTHSRDRVAPTAPVSNGTAVVHTTTNSMRVASNAQPKVDHHRASSKERDVSVAPSLKPEQHQHRQRRSQSRESPSIASNSKQPTKKSSRDHSRMVVPFVPNVQAPAPVWNPLRAVQPYYSNPVFPNQQPNMYMPVTYVPQQNPVYQQPYGYSQRPMLALAYQRPSAYPTTSTVKSLGTTALHSAQIYPVPAQPMYPGNYGMGVPPSFHTFHSNQQSFQPPMHPGYQSQMPLRMPAPWPTVAHGPAGPMSNTPRAYLDSRRDSRNRARSVDMGPRAHLSSHSYNPQRQQPQPQPQPQQRTASTTVEHHYHHHHHHRRTHPAQTQVNTVAAAPAPAPAPPVPETVAQPKREVTAVNLAAPAEKLTIRQLNEIFLRTDTSGRVPYGLLPSLLQRFGISLTENELISAALNLQYNVTEPISARRLVHVLVRLGKIAKSTTQQQPPPSQPQPQPQKPASPTILPEDREVTAIMNQPQPASTVIYASANPNHWY